MFNSDEKSLSERVAGGKIKAGVIGLGYVGVCLAAVLAKKNLSVMGVDVNSRVVDLVNAGEAPIKEPGLADMLKSAVSRGKLRASMNLHDIKGSDVVLITVGTPIGEDNNPDMEHVISVAENLGGMLEAGQMVILKSTLVPGTTEEVVKPILEQKSGMKAGVSFGLAFCPERLAEGNAIEELQKLPIVVGGINRKSSACASAFWQGLNMETIVVGNPKTAEMVKLADNLWIDLNIALANELGMLCEKIGIDFFEVMRAANTLPKGQNKVNILFPGSGVGGSCLVKDPWFVYHTAKKYGLKLKTPVISREINDSMPAHMFELIKDALKERNKKLSDAKISVLGLAFKCRTGDTRNTHVKKLLDLLLKSKSKVTLFDPWVSDEDARKITNAKIGKSLDDALKNADCIAVATDQPEFKEITMEYLERVVKPDCCVVDGRNVFNPDKVKAAGFIYRGVGRGA